MDIVPKGMGDMGDQRRFIPLSPAVSSDPSEVTNHPDLSSPSVWGDNPGQPTRALQFADPALTKNMWENAGTNGLKALVDGAEEKLNKYGLSLKKTPILFAESVGNPPGLGMAPMHGASLLTLNAIVLSPDALKADPLAAQDLLIHERLHLMFAAPIRKRLIQHGAGFEDAVRRFGRHISCNGEHPSMDLMWETDRGAQLGGLDPRLTVRSLAHESSADSLMKASIDLMEHANGRNPMNRDLGLNASITGAQYAERVAGLIQHHEFGATPLEGAITYMSSVISGADIDESNRVFKQDDSSIAHAKRLRTLGVDVKATIAEIEGNNRGPAHLFNVRGLYTRRSKGPDPGIPLM